MAPWVIPLLFTAAGTGVQMVNERNANKKRQSMLNAMAADQSRRTQANASNVLREAQKYAPEERAPQEAAVEQAALGDYDKALVASENVSAPDARAGKLSQDYKTGSPAAIAKQTAASRMLAELMAKVRAPGDLRMNESMRRAGVAEKSASDLTDARFAANAGAQDAAGVRPNPWMQLVGQGLQAYGAYSGASAATNAERLKTLQMMSGSAAPAAGTAFTMPRTY